MLGFGFRGRNLAGVLVAVLGLTFGASMLAFGVGALPTETKVESGTSQSKSETSVYISNGGKPCGRSYWGPSTALTRA